MADDRKLKYQASIVRWESMYGCAMASELTTAQVGLFVLKTAVTANGAALIAVLAAFPQMSDMASFQTVVMKVGQSYALGVALGLLSAGVAYFYQSIITAKLWNDMHEDYPDGSKPPPFPWAERTAKRLAFPMIGLAFFSFVMFCIGSWRLLEAFDNIVIP